MEYYKTATENLINHSVKLAHLRTPYLSLDPHCGMKSLKNEKNN